jgi:5-methylcytosine-specific restriction protein A
MPRRAARPCAEPGCPRLVRGQDSRCPEHQRAYEKEMDARRGTPSERGYDARWQVIRERFLKDHPRCEKCGSTATVAHHVVRRRNGGADNPRNLMALCASCHSRLHALAGHNWNKK